MKRTLKIFWLNFAFLLTVIILSAIGFKETIVEAETTSLIDGRYHWADVERDVLIEIKDGEYTETQQTGESALREVVSSGYCFRSDGRILLLEQGTDISRSFESVSNGIREIDTGLETPREFEHCVHPSALIERGENPYSVDGVQLGMSEADVEAIWGELSLTWCGWNTYDAKNGRMVGFDTSGKVISVSGSTLYEFSRPLSGEELICCGHFDPLCANFGSDLGIQRIAGDYQIAISNPVQPEALKEFSLPVVYDPFEADRMPESLPQVSLGYRH